MLIGTLTLVGWVFHITDLVKISSSFAAMTMGTAVGFILSGLLILAVTHPRINIDKNWSIALDGRLTGVLIGLILVISGAYLIEHIFSVDLGIDFAAYHQVMGSNGRSAINTVCGFFLFALGVLSYIKFHQNKHNSGFRKLPNIFAILVLSIGS